MLAADARPALNLLDHTGDLAFEVRSPSLDGLFEAAALGLVDAITDATAVRSTGERSLALEAADREMLLVRLLRETLALYEVDRWLAGRAEVRVAPDERSLSARLGGEPFDPARHPIKTEVKAVTYHALAVCEEAAGFRAVVVLDL